MTGTLVARTDGSVISTVRARDLWRQIARAAWECADPGLQFDTTINDWHTASNTARINASNPCSEYMHIDNSACNLASLNLMKFLDEDGRFDVDGFSAAIEVVFTAQEILVGNADYPTKKIGENSIKFRQLGLGYANLGALLMASGLPVRLGRRPCVGRGDHRAHDRATPTRRARAPPGGWGRSPGFHENAEPMLRVLRKHRDAADEIDDAVGARRAAGGGTTVLGRRGRARRAVRRAQLAGDGARADRHDRAADGLRHDRRRAGPRAREDEEARRRRDDVDRQPDRAARAARWRATRAEQAATIVAYIDEHKSILGRTAPASGAPRGVRVLDGRQRRSTTSAT